MAPHVVLTSFAATWKVPSFVPGLKGSLPLQDNERTTETPRRIPTFAEWRRCILRTWYPLGFAEANFVTTPWDIRALLRAFGATLLGLVVVWLVTAASDEGQLTVGARAGRTLPLAPLCSAVGVALALGTSRVRQEALAFESLGRSPAQISRAAALGAALPSLLVALAIGVLPPVDVSAFYPRAVRGDTFTFTEAGFVSPSLGVRIDADGDTHVLEGVTPPVLDDNLPRGARLVAALVTAFAGLGFSLVTARATLRRSLLDARARRRMQVAALVEGVTCTVLTLIAFHASAARAAPTVLAAIPPAALLALALVRLRWGYGGAHGRRVA